MLLKRFYFFAALMLICGVNIAYAQTAKSGMPKVNGVAIPQAHFDFVLRERLAQGQPDNAQLRDSIREDLIMRELISQEANKKGIAKKPEVQSQLALSRQNILIRGYLQDYVKAHNISDDILKKEYEEMKKQIGDKEYKARHILVEKQDDAKAIIEQLNKGAKFADLAAEKSNDPGSKTKGGELDWTVPGSYVVPFANALVNLEKGKYTQKPIQTQFGWHVIQLDDVRNAEPPAFDQVKQGIQQRLQQQQIDKLLDELRAKAKIQ
jgi:peptidyl-prolyl cis-trans isomerase C